MKELDKLWESYSKTKDHLDKEQLIIEYAHLVKYVAGRMSIHIGQYVEYDDLVGYGIFGLIDAIEKFDLEKGVKFETYASLRIRGSIIDSIRKMDWVPRTLRQKNKQVEQVYASLEAALGREPTDEEAAAKLNISVDELNDMIKKANLTSLISLDDYLEQNYETGKGIVDNKDSNYPESSFEKQEMHVMLVEAINKLSEKEKKVISLYYFEELTLKEISSIMGVSESRISQIHSKAVLKLKSKLIKFKSLIFGLWEG